MTDWLTDYLQKFLQTTRAAALLIDFHHITGNDCVLQFGFHKKWEELIYNQSLWKFWLNALTSIGWNFYWDPPQLGQQAEFIPDKPWRTLWIKF